MDFTWIAIFASLAMAIGTALIFVFAVKGHYFEDLEDTKYQVFWSDLEDLVDNSEKEEGDGRAADDSGGGGERSSDH